MELLLGRSPRSVWHAGLRGLPICNPEPTGGQHPTDDFEEVITLFHESVQLPLSPVRPRPPHQPREWML